MLLHGSFTLLVGMRSTGQCFPRCADPGVRILIHVVALKGAECIIVLGLRVVREGPVLCRLRADVLDGLHGNAALGLRCMLLADAHGVAERGVVEL